jgi:hypothetical protein
MARVILFLLFPAVAAFVLMAWWADHKHRAGKGNKKGKRRC